MPIDQTNTQDVVGNGYGNNPTSVDQYGLAGAANFDLAPETLNCGQKMAAFCAFAPNLCFLNNNEVVPTDEGLALYLENYPECAPTENQIPLQTKINSNDMTNEIFDINSPNFLGGNNVHNVILIVLALLILVVVTKGSLLTAPVKALKQAV
jgi:hypothetical protein